jgi:peptidyl-prolyl cis-trans isomerase-like protein 2
MPNQDKLFVTATEHAAAGGYKAPVQREFARLPYTCCCLSLSPWTNPVAAVASSTSHVYLFDLLQIVPYVRRHGAHPISGDPLTSKDLVKLQFHKNGEGAFACPATGKVFGEHTKLAAVRTTGHVYSYEALDTLCFGPRNLKDLVDGTAFTRSDVLVLQDSANPEWLSAHRASNIRSLRDQQGGDSSAAASAAASGEVLNSGGGVIRMGAVGKAVLEELPKAAAASAGAASGGEAAHVGSAHVSGFNVRTTHHCAASLTSTAVPLSTKNTAAAETEEDRRAARSASIAALGKKGLVRLQTSKGELNLELHCDLAPTACENFLLLAQAGAYDGTVFHRSIKNFMVQGGDPTGSGRGGKSAWGKPFRDEFSPKLSHAGRGVLSMANSGPNTNGSQFFITYKSCPHLDRKHTVFGRLVGGEATLAAMEAVGTDGQDRPKEAITITRVLVFADPTSEVPPSAGGQPALLAARGSGAGGGGEALVVVAREEGGGKRGAEALPPPAALSALLQDGDELAQQPKKAKKGNFDFSKW